jgi:hypothetical protein
MDGSGTRPLRPDLFAFACACVFFGAALYVNIVEQPARLSLGARSIIREWTPSNRRGFMMFTVLVIISALSGYTDYIRTGDVRLLIGATIILASWPYALFRDEPSEHLVVWSSPECTGLGDPRAHARLESG